MNSSRSLWSSWGPEPSPPQHPLLTQLGPTNRLLNWSGCLWEPERLISFPWFAWYRESDDPYKYSWMSCMAQAISSRFKSLASHNLCLAGQCNIHKHSVCYTWLTHCKTKKLPYKVWHRPYNVDSNACNLHRPCKGIVRSYKIPSSLECISATK